MDVILHQIENEALESTWIFEDHNFKPLCKLKNGSIYPIITDHLGTPREMIDIQGKIVWRTQYESWGVPLGLDSCDFDMPIRFPGQWFDCENGLYYNRFRYYDGQTGRYLSQDPIGIIGGLNLYSYVTNPTNWIDPLGLARREVPKWVQRLPAGMSKETARNTTLRDAMLEAGRPGSTIQQIPDHLLDSTVEQVSKAMPESDEAETAMKLLKQDKTEKSKSKDHC